jgi:hypothetical protein
MSKPVPEFVVKLQRRKAVKGQLCQGAVRLAWNAQARPDGTVSLMLGTRQASGELVLSELQVPKRSWCPVTFGVYLQAQDRPS